MLLKRKRRLEKNSQVSVNFFLLFSHLGLFCCFPCTHKERNTNRPVRRACNKPQAVAVDPGELVSIA